ncbi:hypothetical protein EVAR_64521_1 [Eumeta japonica]|uniref:Uncharacterized protein n=1 Tax=Eumeta variegata TaxID=151549 RepID=A0A4C1ZHZ4_EUMVA|nr:hypothetical protein EVAR_64521_1 [Eumeta japonica]
MVTTAVHRHSQPHWRPQCVAALLERNKISDRRGTVPFVSGHYSGCARGAEGTTSITRRSRGDDAQRDRDQSSLSEDTNSDRVRRIMCRHLAQARRRADESEFAPCRGRPWKKSKTEVMQWRKVAGPRRPPAPAHCVKRRRCDDGSGARPYRSP